MFHPFQSVLQPPRRRGQVAVFLLMVLTALAFALLWNVDIHRIITTKTRSQNAGDAAALAGARWQGIGINLVGEMNLLHALALSANDAAAVDAITNIQARVLFTAPLMGFAAAQVAAKNNGMYAEDAFTQIVLQHAQDVLQYGVLIGGVTPFAPPYDHAWDDYWAMLTALAGDGIAAGPDNTWFYNDSSGGHILLDRGFYNAIAGKTWCWFFLNHPTLLQAYTDYHWWPPVPPPTPQVVYNSEFLPLWLVPRTTTLDSIINTNNLEDEAARDGVIMTGFIATNVMRRLETWYVYDNSHWGPWTQMSMTGTDPFPLAGTLRPEYDYVGADVMFRVSASVTRMTPGLNGSSSNQDKLVWTGAAKPFGAVGPTTAPRLPPNQYGLVLPSFAEVRLIPIDACSGAGNGTFDVSWREHVNVHLPLYLASGPINNGCWYCGQLTIWEDPAFRQEGISWLSANSFRCTLPTGGGGGGGGGGTAHGH